MKATAIKAVFLSMIFLSIICFSNCVNNNEEDLYGDDCDTLGMTYSKVKYIFENNCYGCHTVPQGIYNIKLDTYSDVKAAVNKSRLEGAIEHKNGFVPMPQDQPKLDDCSIDKIEAWIHEGMPE
jgi:hypothetical protein